MLLSIVECNSKISRDDFSPKPTPVKIAEDVEEVGPVFGQNAAQMRNRGYAASNGRWIFFKDADCEIDVSGILNLIRSLPEDENLAVVGGVYKGEQETSLQAAYHRIQKVWQHSGMQERDPETGLIPSNRLLGGVLLVRRQSLAELGGFNERIGFGAEELEFAQRAQRHGHRTAVTPRLSVRHKCHHDVGRFVKRAWVQNYNASFFNIKTEKINSTSNKNYFSKDWKQNFWISVFFTSAVLARGVARSRRWLN